MRIGLWGGTFDPPHAGHLLAAEEAHRLLSLDRLLFVPAARPPHKAGRAVTPPELRLAMVQAAVAGDPRFQVEDLELGREGASYTVDTLAELRERYSPEVRWVLVIGADWADGFPGWRNAAQILEWAEVAILRRGGEAEPRPRFPSTVVESRTLSLSSTEVRHRVAAGESIRGLVPRAVEEIILREGLYRS